MAGLNLTRQNHMDMADVEQLRAIGGTVGDFAADILEFSVKNSDFTSICDACAVAWWVDDRVIHKEHPDPGGRGNKGRVHKGHDCLRLA